MMNRYNKEYFFPNFRMSPTRFEELLALVAPRILKSSAKSEAIYIAPEERLCVTLRYLVTCDAQTTISPSFRISKTSVGRIVKETSQALVLLE